jgi:hypothetical protein
MPHCKHHEIVLLTEPGKKLRCRHCHLVINEEDLSDGNCPECYEVSGLKRSDFEPIEPKGSHTTRYSCEACGAIITI